MSRLHRTICTATALVAFVGLTGFSCDSPKSASATPDPEAIKASQAPLDVSIVKAPTVRKVVAGSIEPSDLVPVRVRIVNRSAVNIVLSTDAHHLRLVLYKNGVIVSDPLLQNSVDTGDITKGLVCLPSGESLDVSVPFTGVPDKVRALDANFKVVVQLLGISVRDMRVDESRRIKRWAKEKRGTLYQRPRFESNAREMKL